MSSEKHSYTFTAKLSKYEGDLWGNYFRVDSTVASNLKASGIKRWLCTINDAEPMHSGLMGDGNGGFFILLNNAFCKKYHLNLGDALKISLRPDNSDYGMSISDEFVEVLHQTEGAFSLFEALTPGKRRNLIYFVDSVKSSEIKIRRALVVCNHLSMNPGSIDFKRLNAELKEANRAAKMK